MKTFLAALLALSVPALADDFTLANGKKITGSLSRVEPNGIVIETDSGVQKVPFSDLKAEDLKKYGYDPAKAEAFSAAQAQAAAEKSRMDGIRIAAEQKRFAEINAQAEQAAKSRQQAEGATAPAPIPSAPASTALSGKGSLLQADHGVTISGLVIQRTADGLLVETKKGVNVWLKGTDANEGKRVSVPASKIGTKSYMAVSGAETMVDLYQTVTAQRGL